MAVYATPADVRPLLGNIEAGITDDQLNLAIASATDEINARTNRQPPNDWQTTDANFDLVKKIARYLTAIESSLGVADYEETREAMRKELARMFEVLLEFGTDTETDFVESSEGVTYAGNPVGLIWSARYKNLRKNPVADNEQYSFINDIGS
jgi:hypothetical protein